MHEKYFSTRYIPAEGRMPSNGGNRKSDQINRPSLGIHSVQIGILHTRARKSLVAIEIPTQEELRKALELGYKENELSKQTKSKINQLIARKLGEAAKIKDGTIELTELTDLINQSNIIKTKQKLDLDTVRAFYNKNKNIDLTSIEHDLQLLKKLDKATNTTNTYNESKGLSKALLNGLYPKDSRIIISQARAITGANHLESNGEREAVVIGTTASLNNATGSEKKTAIKVHVKANQNNDPRAKGKGNFITQIHKTVAKDAKRREFTIQPENIVRFK
ncbi:MAG: hypothetical protein O3C63_02555 [Cyanobacteria bacterium]|nr:hypothetical protein [Cyanobacteriota bacterium]